MAFSGQYAAAQLHHLPLPHLVIGELSDFLGYAPNFAPPSFVEWARLYGRLPSDDEDETYDYVCWSYMLPSEFRHNDFRNNYFGDNPIVHAIVLRGDRTGYLDADRIEVRPEQVRPALFEIRLLLNTRYEDIQFVRRWANDHRNEWPATSNGIHPAIAGAVRIYRQHAAMWYAHNNAQWEFQRMRNRRLEV
jgi:hypothetical protein